MNIQLIGPRVLIEPVEEETRLGFLIPESYREFRTGFVKSVGNGARLKNKRDRKPIPLSVGDHVVLADGSLMPIHIEGKRHFIVTDDNVLCVLEK